MYSTSTVFSIIFSRYPAIFLVARSVLKILLNQLCPILLIILAECIMLSIAPVMLKIMPEQYIELIITISKAGKNLVMVLASN